MKRTLFPVVVVLFMAGAQPALAGDEAQGRITGRYVEVRSADVYVGACYANAELGLVGREGTLAWNFRSGTYEGVPLKGLSVVAVLLANSTLGSTFDDPYPVRSVLLLDEQASARQRRALRHLAQAMAGRLLGDVVREEIVPIRFESESSPEAGHETHLGPGTPSCARVTAGSQVVLQTRELRHSDNLCANAELFYPPLTAGLKGAMPVFASQMAFSGPGLGVRWSIPDKRGGFVATLDLNADQLTAKR